MTGESLAGSTQSKDLQWPPTAEDLRRMYVDEKLSAAKIAKAYGLNRKYASPKTAESTILYHLKRYGIARRDKAEHSSKVTREMEDEWIHRYENGESLKIIADYSSAMGIRVTHVTVFNHLRARGVKLRNKVEAQIKAVTKHQKRPFDGGTLERAYLIGFARGDLNVSGHGRAIRVKTATTHPLMVKHIRQLFGPYSHVLVHPRLSGLAGYEWSVQADLDRSFEFLLEFRRIMPDWVFGREAFPHFLGGLFDAEGSIWFNDTTIIGFAVSITNSDVNLLTAICSKLREQGFRPHMGKERGKTLWKVNLWRQDEVYKFIRYLGLRHPEKVAKASVALKAEGGLPPDRHNAVVSEWDSLRAEIKKGRDEFIQLARERLKLRSMGN